MGFKEMKIAEETVQIIENGGYNNIQLNNEDIYKAKLYSPIELDNININIPLNLPNGKIKVYNLDTCECAKIFIESGKTCILNFASAMNVGGGFLSGANAQEEAICRNSTLYASINSPQARYYYDYNIANKHTNPMYSNYMIFSPYVEVIRDSNGNLLEKPYTISAITSPAVNLNKAKNCSPDMIYDCMLNREECILKVAISNNIDNLILGAWGCGVFGNNPTDIANQFKFLLIKKGYIKCFKNVAFAIYDKKGYNFQIFLDAFKIL